MGHSQVLEKVSAHIAELLVLKIESMTQTWQKPWFYGQGLLPCNITGKRYAGTNLLTLLMLTEVKGYRTPVFLTFRQAKERGLTVRKGSKQFPVVFWKPFYQANNPTDGQRRYLTVEEYTALPESAPCLGSARTQFYRNKLEFTFADRRWLTREEVEGGADIGAAPALGFHIPGMFDKVLDIRKCWLQPDPSNGIRMEAKRFCVENGYTFHNARSHEGLMRNMIVRTASTGEVMVIVVFNSDDRPRITALMDHLAAKFPEITSLFYIVNTKFNDSVGDLDPVCYRGKDHIIEEMEELRFKVGPKSFYQTNSAQAYELYKVARDFADLRPGDVLYDLYTGTGTIANFCAARCARVVGVEYVPEAIADAKVNSELNGIENTVFYAGDMKAVLDDGFVAANGRPDVIILDPPRAGVDEPVIEVILRAAPERIVYVRCNPATQARDLQLMDAAYRVAAVQPVDMFPHTPHVENVVQRVRR